jgi:predicted GNAT family acetyltransferase
MENLPVMNNEKNLRFEIDADNDKAFLEYRWKDDKLALMHTFVPEQHAGKGIAGLLARTALEYAKSNGIKIIVYCPYVAAFIKKHPEYEALVEKK